jgi:hypothetical protein
MTEEPHWKKLIRSYFAVVLAAITLLTAVVNFVSIKNDVYFYIKFLAVIGLGLVWTFCLYVISHRTLTQVEPVQSRYQYDNKRHRQAAWVGIIVIPLVVLFLLILIQPPTNTPIPSSTPTNTPIPSSTPTNTPTPSSTPTPTPNPIFAIKIANSILGENEDNYRTEVIILNESERDVSVNHVTIRWNTGFDACTCDYPPCSSTYSLSDQITVYEFFTETLNFEAQISPQSGGLSGYEYNARGTIQQGCGLNYFSLDFATPSFVLSSSFYHTMYIDIPRKFGNEYLPRGFEFDPITGSADIDLILSTDIGEIFLSAR